MKKRNSQYTGNKKGARRERPLGVREEAARARKRKRAGGYYDERVYSQKEYMEMDRDKAVSAKRMRESGDLAKKKNREVVDEVIWRKNKKAGKKKVPAKKRLTVLFIAVVLLFGIGYFCFQYMRVENIAVDGVEGEDAQNVIALSGLIQGTHIFNVDREKAKEQIDAEPYYEYRSIEYDFPNSVVIHVNKRRVSGAFEHNGRYVLIDENGIALGKQNIKTALKVPVLYGLGTVTYEIGYEIRVDDTEKQGFMTALLAALNDSTLAGTIRSVDFTNKNNAVMVNDAGMKIEVGEEKDVADKIKFASKVLERLKKEGKTKGRLDASSKARISYFEEGSDVSKDIIT